MNRKTFLRTCGALSVGTAPAAALLGGCASGRKTLTTRVEGNKVSLPLSEFTEMRGTETAERRFVLVRPEGMSRPICVYRKGPREFTALSTTCTHRGCEVRPNDEYLSCPCHGSEYSTTGAVLHGPAEQPLKSFPTSVEDDQIVIRIE